MRVRHIIKNRKGFSLTELLVTVLILGLVSSVVAGGIPVARDAYLKITVSANAQVLMSTVISSLRSQLGPSQIADETLTEATEITYLSGKNGAYSTISLDTTSKAITIQEFKKSAGDTSPSVSSRILVPGTDDLYATYDTISYADDMVTISGLTVKKDEKEYVDPVDLSIRVFGN